MWDLLVVNYYYYYCFFIPEDTTPQTIVLPFLISAQFDVFNPLLTQCLNLACLLPQSNGDRAFTIHRPTTFDQHLSADMKDTVGVGLHAHELVVELCGWNTVNASIELRCDHPETRCLRSYSLHFRAVTPSFWPEFCSSLASVDTRDASLRIVCEREPSDESSGAILRELCRLTVSSMHITGKWSPFMAVKVFHVMREVNRESADTDNGLETALPFAALRDICVHYHRVVSPEPTTANDGWGSQPINGWGAEPPANGWPTDGWGNSYPIQPSLDKIDEAAPYLLWYARARRNRLFQTLRTVALPSELLQKPWVRELEELLEQEVVSYEAFMEAQDETEKTGCRAVVLYRPVLGSPKCWDTWILTFVPVIATVGILWTSTRRR